MNVVVETLPNCLATLRIEVPADRISKERTSIVENFRRYAKIPGFRPGKAPVSTVQSRYAKEIQEELTSKIVRAALSEAVEDKKLKVLSVSKVEGDTIAADDSMNFTATVIMEPEFELPDYSAIPSGITRKVVTDEEINDFLKNLCEPHASFDPVEGRPAAMGDFVVITYAGSLDGQPLEEAVQGAPQQLCGKRNAWLLLDDNSLMPGFSQAIEGMTVNEERTITIPSDSTIEGLAGKSIEYAVTLHAINQKTVPPLDDALAEKIEPGATVEILKSKVRDRLQGAADYEFEHAKRQAAVQFLLSKVECDLPEAFISREMKSILQNIVRDNQMRGISDEELQQHQDEIIGAAQTGARERVRTNFLLARIAAKEKLEVNDSDLSMHIYQLSARYEIPVKKLVADLRKSGGFDELREQILGRKALDLLAANVTVPSA